ncbi:hypothetical protein PsorP6_004983 [Peronosclerospora sorghi]|uniref:Uncharacterized protein n=1 Tax=Peronosclerospora sorghi TaxID=230839 RepID=A0ACC0W4X2_9STRA|nr:hypothetical protein PsorP6_004983 [Peronosclerospora sorghi]
MEVIELDDSSGASSEEDYKITSTASSIAKRSHAQSSVGYADAVEVALAMAAALKPGTSTKKKKTALAPPLVPTKAKKQSTRHQVGTRRPQHCIEKKRSGSNHTILSSHKGRARQQSSKTSNRFSSRDESSSESDAISRTLHRSTISKVETPVRARRLNVSSKEARPNCRRQVKRRQRAQVVTPPTNQLDSAEIVDLLSSSDSCSSSSGLPVVRHSRSLSASSLSSSEASMETPLISNKKQPVRKDSASSRKKPNLLVRPVEKAKIAGAQQVSPSACNKSSSIVSHVGKHKRVVLQKRQDSSTKAFEDISKKMNSNTKKAVVNGQQTGDTGSTSLNRKQNVAPASSSPIASPSPLPLRKSMVKSSSAKQVPQTREGEVDAFGRHHCRKSVPSPKSSDRVKSAPPSPASDVSISSSSSISMDPPRRKKRRVYSRFNVDQVALNDLQAQERELAWIRSQHKQLHISLPSSKSSVKKRCDESKVVDTSRANNTACLKKVDCSKQQLDSAKPVQEKPVVLEQSLGAGSHRAMLHPTSYRGVFFDEAPLNILNDQACSVPFTSKRDHPLTFYDETDNFASQCSILESFGKRTQCISSVFPREVPELQSDVTRSVKSLVGTHLPTIRRCFRKKVRAILAEARQNICAYQTALKKYRGSGDTSDLKSRPLPRSSAEKKAVKLAKTVKHTCSLSDGSVSFQIGHSSEKRRCHR